MQVRVGIVLFWSGPLALFLSFERTCASACLGPKQIDDLLSDAEPRRIECFKFDLRDFPPDLDASGFEPYNATGRFSRGNSSGYTLLLGALLPLHDSSQTYNASTCTGIRRLLMVELVEAVLMAIGEMVDDSEVAFKLISGVEIRDSCGMSEAAAEGARALSRLAVGREATCSAGADVRLNEAKSTRCDGGQQLPEVEAERVFSVVGPASSTEVDVASPIFNAHQLPHFSFWSTSDRFNRKLEYPFLFRTTTSDAYQAWAIVEILKHFEWSYVYMLHGVHGSYRASLADSVRTCSLSWSGGENSICFAQDEGFEFHDTPKINRIIRQWHNASVAKGPHRAPSVILLFAGYRYADAILNAMAVMASDNVEFARWMATEHFVWIASDAWISAAVNVIHNTPRAAEMGNHTVIGTTFQVPDYISRAAGFKDRLLKDLHRVYPDKGHVHSNPWLGLVWQETFGCRLPFLNCSGAACGKPPCNTSVSVAEAFNMEIETFSLPITSGSLWLAVQSAVWLLEEVVALSDGPLENLQEHFSEALEKAMRQDKWDCRARHASPRSTCGIFREQDLTNDILVQVVQRTGSGRWHLKTLATWVVPSARNQTCQSYHDPSQSNIKWADPPGDIRWANGQRRAPLSVCSTPCPIGSIQLGSGAGARAGGVDRPRKCCWRCVPCGDGEYHDVGVNSCVACHAGSTPLRNKTGCAQLPHFYLGYGSSAGVAILVLSAASFVVAVVFALLFVRRRRQLVVRLSGLELSVLLLVAVAGGSLANAFLLARPSAQTCKFDNTLAAANVIFSLIVLVWRCLRHISLSTRKGIPHWLYRLAFVLASSRVRQVSLVVVAQTIVSLVFIVYGLYFPITPTSLHSPEKERLDLYCLHEPTTSIGMVFFAVLLLTFIALAVVLRKALVTQTLGMVMLPNEATLLGLTAFLLTVFWSVALAIATLSKGIYLPVVTSVTILLHHFAVLACLFLPRVRILLQDKKSPKLTSQRSLRTLRGISKIDVLKEIGPLTVSPPPVCDGSTAQYHKGASPIAALTPNYLSPESRTGVIIYTYEL